MLDHLHADAADDLPAADPSLLEELAVIGFRPFEEHDDPRPLPNADTLTECLAQAMRQIEMAFADTRLEDDLEDDIEDEEIENLDRVLPPEETTDEAFVEETDELEEP